MLEAWFASKLAPDGVLEDGCHPEEAQALKDYLHHKMNAKEAAQAIVRPILESNDPGDDLSRLWGFLLDALVELPTKYTEPLLALLSAIEDLPKPDFKSLPSNKQPAEDLWAGLGGFGHLWSDSYQSGEWRRQARSKSGAERDTLRNEHIRKAEIEARLVAMQLAGIPIDWGYEVIADALESSNAVLDFEVPAAAQWLVICGARFREGAEKNEKCWALSPQSTISTDVPSRNLWKAPSDQVMNVERWSAWKERLQDLQAEPGMVKNAAAEALRAMHECDHAAS